MLFRKVLMTGVLVSVVSVSLKAQTPSSCDCIVDTNGLKAYLSTINLNENASLQFEVENQNSTFAVLHGVIDQTTPDVVQNFIINYPSVTTLVFMQMPGSADDEANLIASQALHDRGYKHYLPGVNTYAEDAFIASGAVDMFVGGSIRVVETSGEVGVHSWSDGANEANSYPVGHPYHQPYIDYYISVGFEQQLAEDFYYFTINAAPANDIYLMTENEIDSYHIRTCKYNSSPSYPIIMDGNSLSVNLSGSSYQWLDCNAGNAEILGATDQHFTPISNGSYAIIVNEQNCVDTSDCFLFQSMGLFFDEKLNKSQFEIYPNPFINQLTVASSFKDVDLKYQFFTTHGQRIEVDYVIDKNGSLLVRNLHEGLYYIQVEQDGIKEFYKIIKQ
jgi:hypothetical protein